MPADDSQEEGTPIPEGLRTQMLRKMPGVQQVRIEVEKEPNKFAKFQAFNVKSRPGELPEGDDEIIQRVTDAIHNHWLEHSEDEGSLNYRVWCHVVSKQSTKHRYSVQYLYAGPDGEEPDFFDADEQQSTQVQIISQLQHIIASMAMRLDEAYVHMREISGANAKMHEPLTQMVAYSAQLFGAAMEMQRNALFVISEHNKEDRDAKAKDQRLKRYAEMFGPALQRVAPAVLHGLLSKVTGRSPGPPPPSPESDEFAEETDEPGHDEDSLEHSQPLAAIARNWAGMLRPQQWQRVNEKFTKAEVRAFVALLESETDENVLERWGVIEDGGIKLEKLLALYQELDEEQQQGYQQLQAAIALVRDSMKSDAPQ